MGILKKKKDCECKEELPCSLGGREKYIEDKLRAIRSMKSEIESLEVLIKQYKHPNYKIVIYEEYPRMGHTFYNGERGHVVRELDSVYKDMILGSLMSELVTKRCAYKAALERTHISEPYERT